MGEHSKDFICSTGYKPFETLETLDTSIGDRKEFTQWNEKKALPQAFDPFWPCPFWR